MFFAAPVANLFWSADGDNGWLKPPSDEFCRFDVLDAAGNKCDQDPDNGFRWTSVRPRQVRASWLTEGDEQRETFVPVLDEFGRVAATELPKLEVEDVWWQLANFPLPPDDEDLLSEGDSERACDSEPFHRYEGPIATYPVRQLMELVENIAGKQTMVAKGDWSCWCNRLEQGLAKAANSAILEEFKFSLQLNPLSPLWHSKFRPIFAETGESLEGQIYEAALRRVETAWNVSDLSRIGANL